MSLPGLLRSHHCGELSASDIGNTVTLCGWVNKSRDLGGLHFIDIRDKYGITQLNFEDFKGDFALLKEAGLESTIMATGIVSKRPGEASNKKMATGEVEVKVSDFQVLSASDKDNIPFLPFGAIESNEDHMLTYRYLELRTQKLQKMLTMRSDAAASGRTALYEEKFVEVETPILYKSTPEGARDYIVPSRVHAGKVYALPQSPQTLKQLLMIGGADKYFQLVKCFRDEDLRADRQPEFTQLDIEVSFATQAYIKALGEKLLKRWFQLDENFVLEEMTYQKAMELYGSDKPDLRFDLAHKNVTKIVSGKGFKVFDSVAETDGLIKAIFLGEAEGSLARKDIDALTNVVKPYGGKGVAWFKENADGISGGISKFIDEATLKELQALKKNSNELGTWFFFADSKHSISHASADAVRRHLGAKFDLYAVDYRFILITEFPLFDYDEDEKRFVACHHPFTSPLKADEEKYYSGSHEELLGLRAQAYDIVCNGYELAGGSVRIHEQKMQKRMFELLGMSDEEVKRQFGFFIEALNYGVPPHAGIAFGFDRLVMLLAKTDNIRDVIAFPKTTSAMDLMSGTPSIPNPAQLDELHFSWNKKD